MKVKQRILNLSSLSFRLTCLLVAGTIIPGLCRAAPQASAQKAAPAPRVLAQTFNTPQQAADALIKAAEPYDLAALKQILGSDGHDIVVTGEPARDKEMATEFASKARAKMKVSVDERTKTRAFLLIGEEDWPFPVPIVKRGARWSFDSRAGRQELLLRRIGSNELDAIEICRGYVEAQHEYALLKRAGKGPNQYAQRILSTPQKQDGLVWRNADGTLGGPIAEPISRAIEQGYTATDPYHGYYFKILKGQGPAAPLGQLNFVIKGVMIGGFALIATPAQYGVTGIKTFMVSHDGVVYQKDLGPNTIAIAKKIELFNPDGTWMPVLQP
jgi:hypothetical protein